ncbi:MAG TPA: alpha/beta hydrolase [Acidimicrobiales bacterium]|nr:alpha/beta hydrolase [Acidimicrobiales bacterium]
MRCASVKVPLDYTNPTGPTIDIAVNEIPARDASQRIGSLLVNPGGPGGSGIDFVAGGIDLPSKVLDRFDVVGFDPRGVGKSTRLTCGDSTVPAFLHLDSTPDTPDEQVALDDGAMAVADDCTQSAGDLLAHMGTDNTVRDMDTIRRALGDAQFNFLGISYGSLLGLRYAQLFPHTIRAITIDGVVDPTQDFATGLRQQTIAFEKQTGAILDGCPDGGDGCPPGGARAAYDELARRVEQAPIDGSNGLSLGPTELADAALITTYVPSAVSLFYAALSSGLNGRAGPMLQLTNAYRTSVDFPTYTAVECTDSPHPVGADAYHAFAQELIGVSSRFGGTVANELLPCAYWSTPIDSIVGPVTAPDAPPMLVVGTTGDAATPYQQAVDVAHTLAHGRLITYQGNQHAAYGASACVADAEAAYFVDLQLPPEGTTCNN